MPTVTDATAYAAPGVLPIRPLIELSVADVEYAGSLGADLGQLAQTGLPVPAGFVIGAPAFQSRAAAVTRRAALAARVARRAAADRASRAGGQSRG